ncbi:amidase [Cohnella thermotolerans]|uniref:amidase n=1 Tax=Cohnella thermotolerans TaxID=329858 RepID=UPI00047A27DC|nr:amidase [Cohnella thermotolerans]
MNELNAYIRPDLSVEPESEGRLTGLTFAVKDVFDIFGHTSSAGNPDWRRTHGPAERHARAVSLLVREGARLQGSTMTDELMYSLQGENYHYGTPVNPRASGRVPGGSSSGSAVAVAAGDVDFALGTDTGGSVRIPSAYCGVFGFRPCFGEVSMDGVIPLAPSFDTVGWMSAESGVLLEVGRTLLEKQDADAANADFEGLLLPEEAWAMADDDARETLLEQLGRLAGRMPTEWVKLPGGDLQGWAETFRTIQGIEIWEQHGRWIRSVRPAFGPGIAERFEWASTLASSDKEKQYEKKRGIGEALAALLGSGRLLALPTATGEAPPLGLTGERAELQRSRTMQLTCIAGLSGLPQLTVPFVSRSGNPIGLSFIGGRRRDLALLQWVHGKLGGRKGAP